MFEKLGLPLPIHTVITLLGHLTLGQQHSVTEIDHKIFSKVFLSILLIQEGQFSVSGERLCTILVNCLED